MREVVVKGFEDRVRKVEYLGPYGQGSSSTQTAAAMGVKIKINFTVSDWKQREPD